MITLDTAKTVWSLRTYDFVKMLGNFKLKYKVGSEYHAVGAEQEVKEDDI